MKGNKAIVWGINLVGVEWIDSCLWRTPFICIRKPLWGGGIHNRSQQHPCFNPITIPTISNECPVRTFPQYGPQIPHRTHAQNLKIGHIVQFEGSSVYHKRNPLFLIDEIEPFKPSFDFDNPHKNIHGHHIIWHKTVDLKNEKICLKTKKCDFFRSWNRKKNVLFSILNQFCVISSRIRSSVMAPTNLPIELSSGGCISSNEIPSIIRHENSRPSTLLAKMKNKLGKSESQKLKVSIPSPFFFKGHMSMGSPSPFFAALPLRGREFALFFRTKEWLEWKIKIIFNYRGALLLWNDQRRMDRTCKRRLKWL